MCELNFIHFILFSHFTYLTVKQDLSCNMLFCIIKPQVLTLYEMMIMKMMMVMLREFVSYSIAINTAQKMKLLIRISSVNVTKSAGNCGFSQIY